MPHLPAGLPESVVPAASDAIHLLIEYQGTAYASSTSSGSSASWAGAASTRRLPEIARLTACA
jgi:hypothetical protein